MESGTILPRKLLFMARALLCIAVAALVVAPPSASAQGRADAWPSRPVKIIAPYAAGGNSDVIGRLIAQRLSETFNQSFFVENRVGANGALASEAVARAPADGYTLLLAVQPPMTIAPAMARVQYDSIKDFVPISAVAVNGFVLVVNKGFPPRNVAEFISYVKSQPGKLAYAEGSAGSLTHLAMALFLKRAGLEMTNVSYRGNAPAMNDVIAGHLPMMFSNVSDALPQAAVGSIRLLAVSRSVREPEIPDIPTVAESGFPGFNVLTWNGLAAPAGTPHDIVDKIAAELARAGKDPQFTGHLKAIGVEALCNSPDEFAAMIKADTATWSEAVNLVGLGYK